MEEKTRILWISDLVTPTGFSRVAHSIINNLSEKFEVFGLGINYYGDPHPFKFQIFPAPTQGHIYGFNRLPGILQLVKPKIIFMLNDVWVLDSYLRTIKDCYKDNPQDIPKIVVYFPADAEDHDPDWYQNFDIVETAVVYSEFGRAVATKAAPQYKFHIIPHGIEKTQFYKMFETRKEAKEKLFSVQPKLFDSFIFLNANRNQPRKRIDITIEAFKIFVDMGKPDNVKLYLHMGIVDAHHVDVLKMARRFAIEERLILSNLNSGVQRVDEEMLNLIYNSCDVGVNTSLGEGWGLTSMEHAITGAPQIVPDSSTCGDLYRDIGMVVPCKFKQTLDDIMTTGRVVLPEDVAKNMDLIYQNKELYADLSRKSIEKFSSPEYSWKTIAKSWDEIFEKVL
jgi:glycosyltransferase involved in cell wall biosynthesis